MEAWKTLTIAVFVVLALAGIVLTDPMKPTAAAGKDLFSDTGLAWKMFRRGKLKFLPSGIKGKREVREMFDKRQEKE